MFADWMFSKATRTWRLLGGALCALLAFSSGAWAAEGVASEKNAGYYTLTSSTLLQSGTVQNQLSEYALTFRIDNDAFMTRRTVGGLEVNFVPEVMQVTAITVYDATVNGTLSRENLNAALATVSGGSISSAKAVGMERGAEKVALTVAPGQVLYATPVTFTFKDLWCPTAETYTLTFDWKTDLLHFPILAGFENAITAAERQDFLFVSEAGARAPHIRVTGSAWLARLIVKVSGENVSLAEALKPLLSVSDTTFAHEYDNRSTIVVAEMQPGSSLVLDQPITTASFVAASFAETQPLWQSTETPPPALIFQNGVAMTGAFSLRGGTEGGTDPTIDTADAEPLVANLRLTGDTSSWVPSSFMLRCDLRLECLLPLAEEGSWFKDNVIEIRSGRRLVLMYPTLDESLLPDVSFADATARLILAEAFDDGVSHPFPTKYRTLLHNASGTLGVGRDITVRADVSQNDRFIVGQLGHTQTVEMLEKGKTFTVPMQLILGDGEKGSESSGTFLLREGALALQDVELSRNDALQGSYLQEGGTAEMGNVIFHDTKGSALFRVGDGAGDGGSAVARAVTLSAAGSAAGSLAIEVLSDGRLEVGDPDNKGSESAPFRAIDLTASGRQTMTLEGGTLAAREGTYVETAFGDGSMPSRTLRVENGATLDGNGGKLTVSAVSGNGALLAEGKVHIGVLRDYDGFVGAKKPAEGQAAGTNYLTIGQLSGAAGRVEFGYLGRHKADGTEDDAKALEDITAAAATYRGTVAFGQQYSTTLDFSELRTVRDFPYVLDFSGMGASASKSVHITMRLDQYVGTVVRWPSDTTGITLTIIEAGAYGGEAVLPFFPKGGVFEFKRYAGDGTGDLVPVADFVRAPNEDGVTEELTWENPLFTGKGAWIDVEFDKDADGFASSRNTGWFQLRNQNNTADIAGILQGVSNPTQGNWNGGGDALMKDDGKYESKFTSTAFPKGTGIRLFWRPYISYGSLSYPEVWSAVVRMVTPDRPNRCILQIGANHNGYANGNSASLVLATGDEGAGDIVLWLIDGNSAADADNDGIPDCMKVVARAKVVEAPDSAHVVAAVFDGDTLSVYLDGGLLVRSDALATAKYKPLGPGLQVGSMLGDYKSRPGGGYVQDAIWEKCGPVSQGEGGAIDYIRFYKGALKEKALDELSKAAPYIVKNVRFVRDVPRDGAAEGEIETWIDEVNKPWTKETYDETTKGWTPDATQTYAQPDEGTAILLRVAAGDHLLQVNVARDHENGYHSSDRSYGALVVKPKKGTTVKGTVRLVPYGVKEAGYETAETAWITGNPWYATPAKDEDKEAGEAFHYGKLRFTGGVGDPINDAPDNADLHGACYLLPTDDYVSPSIAQGEPTYGAWKPAPMVDGKRTFTRTVTRTDTVTESVAEGAATCGVDLVCDAGVAWFSDLAGVCLKAGATTKSVTITFSQLGHGESEASVTEVGALTEESRETTLTAADAQPSVLTMHAGLSLTRGVEDEAKTWRLTGPVQAEGTVAEGGDAVAGNPNAHETAQASEDVWVAPYSDTASWTFFDRTRSQNYGGEANAEGAARGLYVQGLQTPGRLYLDLTHEASKAAYEASQAFSAQKWYRYGYPGASEEETASGFAPTEATAEDFKAAVAFQVRLAPGTERTLNIDKIPEAVVRTLYVEPALAVRTLADGGSETVSLEASAVPTLRLRSAENAPRLAIHKSVVAAARLDVANVTAANTNALDALALEKGVMIHRGGTDVGAYVVGRQEFDWPLDESSVPTLEVAPNGLMRFLVSQDLSRYQMDLVAHRDAIIRVSDEGASLRAENLTLATGARFGLRRAIPVDAADIDGVYFTGRVSLVGEGEGPVKATLAGLGSDDTGMHGRLRVVGGIWGPAPETDAGMEAWAATATLVVEAAEGRSWRLRTVDLHNLALTKTLPGTVDFWVATPPTVAGKCTVEAGTLKVGTAARAVVDSHAGPAIGHQNLHVAKGATLAMTDLANQSGVLACIPDGKTVSGAGTVAGLLRLNRGAVYDATDEHGMTVNGVITDSATSANIIVKLPADYDSGSVYLTSKTAERTVRRRLYSDVAGVRWNTKGVIRNGVTTEYSAVEAGLPVPNYTGKEGVAWSDNAGDKYEDSVKNYYIHSYQGAGIADVSAVEGYTKAGTYGLNAEEISAATECFTGVWAFDSGVIASVNSGDEELLDATKLCMAYEFGISRLTILPLAHMSNASETDIRRDAQGNPLYVVAEVKLVQCLKERFGFAENSDAVLQKPTFARDVDIVFSRADDPSGGKMHAIELQSFGGEMATDTPTGVNLRYFAIPYTESSFPEGAIPLVVRAERTLSTSWLE